MVIGTSCIFVMVIGTSCIVMAIGASCIFVMVFGIIFASVLWLLDLVVSLP